jgi:hypothetical protein
MIERDAEIDAKPVVGLELRPLVAVRALPPSQHSNEFLAAACSAIPADCTRKMNGPALPSMMGLRRGESTYALSTPKPANADIKCSTVATLAESRSRQMTAACRHRQRMRADIHHVGKSMRRKRCRCRAQQAQVK